MSLMKDTTKRALSFALSVLMIISMLPVSVFAANVTSPSTLTTDIGQKSFVVGTATEFTFTTTANGDAGTMVRGSFVFSDPSAIATLEYKESQNGNWYVFSGDFGPEEGFPMTDATSQFRVTFKKAGIYTLDAYIKAVDGGTVLCSTSATVKVDGRSSLSTDIESKTFVVNESTEFSFTTMANEDAGTLVIGSFVFSDNGAIDTLEYQESQDGSWHEFNGDFGPATGFPLTNNATSHFRATFNKAGTYTLTVYMKDVETGDALCFTVATVTVKARAEISFSDENIEIKFSDVNAVNSTLVDSVDGAEYTYSSDNDSVVKVNEYGILTPVSLGRAKITVTRKENTGYMSASASYTVTVVEGVQDELVWDKSVPETIAWNNPDGYSNTVSGGSGTGSVTYTSDNTEIAEVDPVTGVLTLKKPGTVTITATKDGGTLYGDQTANYILVIVKAEQAPIEFDEKNPNAIYVFDEYTNEAHGGSTGGQIQYENSDDTVASVDENGKVTALRVPDGQDYAVITITATLEGNDYYEDAPSAAYTLTIYRVPQTSLVFSKGTTNQTIKFDTKDYANVIVSGGNTEPIKYSSSDESVAKVDPVTGSVEPQKAGIVTITATAPQTEEYEAQTLSYDLVIELADQTVVFENGNTNIPAITYGDSYQNKASATTDITYSSSDPTVAEVDSEGNLIIKKAGTVTITVTAVETEQYVGASDSYTITINKADQVISFEKGENPEVTFNDNENKFSNDASSNATRSGEADVDVIYTIASGSELVKDFDSAKGTFTITGAGTIIVTVSFSTNDRYKANLASYTLVVEKDDQEISFDKESYEMTNGDNSFVSPVITIDGAGTGSITYSIKEDKNSVISKIDPTTGELTFTGNTGYVVILATKAEDANYNLATAKYELTVNEWNPQSDYFYPDGDTINNSGWYTGNVSIVAQEGYLLSYERVDGEAEWFNILTNAVTEDGIHEIKFYVKSIETGFISNQQSVEIKKDETDPTAQINHENLSGWEKFLSIITLGLWQLDEMNFSISYDDITSKVAKVEYFVAEGTTDIMDETSLDAVDKWEEYNGSIPVEKDKIFVVYAKVTDTAGNHIYATTNGIVFDRTAVPEESIVINAVTEDSKGFYDKDVELNVQITDAEPSSGISKVYYEVFNNDVRTQGGPDDGVLYQFVGENPTYDQLVPSWSGNITVDAEKNNSDFVVVKITVVDNAGNESTNEIDLKICIDKPTMDVSYIDDPAPIETFENVTYYDANRVAKIVITGRTSVFTASDAAKFVINQTKGDTANGNTYEVVDWETTEVPGNPDAATHTYLIKFNGSANYDFTVDYTDIFGNNLNHESNKFAVDHDLPTASVTIDEDNIWTRLLETLTFGLWKNSAVTVKASATDATSPIRSIEYYKSNSNTVLTTNDLANVTWSAFEEFSISSDEQFTIYLKVTDRAGQIDYICSDGYIVDMKDSNIAITPDEPNENGIYGDDFNVRIDVNDIIEGIESYSGINTVEYWVTCDGVETIHKTLYSFEYVRDEGENSNGGHLIVKELDENGDLVTVLDEENFIPVQSDLKSTFTKTVTVDAQANNSDHVFVSAKVVDNAGNGKENIVTSDELRVDVVAPKIDVSFDVNDANAVNGRYYFNSDRVAKIVFTERTTSFDRKKATAGIVLRGVDGNDQELILDRSAMIEWAPTVEVEGDPDAATHTAYVSFTNNANYDFTISYTDQAGHPCEYDDVMFANGTVAPRYFTVDKEQPNIKIEYSESLPSKLINMLTFGFYSLEKPLTVTISAEDNLALEKIKFTAKGVKGKYDGTDASFGATVNLVSNSVDSSMKIDVSTRKNDAGDILSAYISFQIPAEFKGAIEAVAYDCAEYQTEQKDNDKKYDEVIVDSIAPDINISYEAKNVENTKVHFVDVNNADVDSFEKANQALYNGDVNATITITENNFFEGEQYTDGGIVHEVGILVTKTDNNGVVTTTEYLPVGASKRFKDANNTVEFSWDTKGNVHKYTIPYDKDADYVITVEYVDFSGNKADIAANDGKTSKSTYTSKIVTVDKTAPIVKVEYKNKDVKATYDARQYYIADQVATITVEEHNFRADDFKAVITAKYSDNTDVSVEDFAAKLADDSKWTKKGNTYTIELNYTVDANYTFDYTYEDLAHNPAKEYVTDEFTVDKVNPENLTVTYEGDVKTSILDRVLNVLTFGYYDAKVKVTVSAYDDVSGIDHFVYSYIKADGVSSVNASLENEIIASAAITQTGKTFTATFEIPKAMLQDTNQFNGTVKFTAYDLSTRNTEHKETAVIIVDNIAPKATITYNEPVQTVEDVSYYAGNIEATIEINEANFNSEDVVVRVNDAPVNVRWTDNSPDIHTGTFTLTEDGDYKVTVNYTDRSTNQMTPYESNQLTIDTKNPVINVSDVKHQSANNKETISFTISVTDINIPLENFKPVLNAVIKKDNGHNSFNYETKSIPLGDATTNTNANGETVHSYTLSNLEADGYYSLSCTAVDYANHSVSIINAAADEGGNAAVETMNFSVNREGSVFWIETEHNDKYTSETFTDKLNGTYANDKVVIKLHEINVDKVDENADKRTVFTLNDGSKSEDIVLKENENYSKNVVVGTGGWYETIYTLDNNTFDHDGVYSLNVITYDKAGNSNVNTKTEAGAISFTLDRTSPVISANVRTNQSVRDTQFWVNFEITETNLDAETIMVKLTNNDGETVETKVEDLGNNEYKFLVESGYNYSIEIVAKDFAGNESELYKVEHFTVSTNILILWYANTPLFWGSIGGTVLLAGLIILLIFLKKRKKNEEK